MWRLIKRSLVVALVAAVLGLVARKHHHEHREHAIYVQMQTRAAEETDRPDEAFFAWFEHNWWPVQFHRITIAPGRRRAPVAPSTREPAPAGHEATAGGSYEIDGRLDSVRSEDSEPVREPQPVGVRSDDAASESWQPAIGTEPPEWTKRGAWLEPPVEYHVVAGELWTSPQEAIADSLQRAADEAAKFLQQQGVVLPRGWKVPLSTVRTQLVQECYVHEREWVFGPADATKMYRAYLLVRFSPESVNLLRQQARDFAAATRLRWVGAGFAFILCTLLTVLGGLKLDDLSRGYYSKWIAAGSVALLAGLAGLLAVFMLP